MPITPFHFGPGGALYAVAPKRISFLAFCAANVLTDLEPLYYMVTAQARLHRFLHTYVGATLTSFVTCVLFVAALGFARRVRVPNPFKWQSLGLPPVVVGAGLGAYSHIALDSVMHDDITPFAPFSDANPLLHAVSLSTLHMCCMGAGAFALLVIEMFHKDYGR